MQDLKGSLDINKGRKYMKLENARSDVVYYIHQVQVKRETNAINAAVGDVLLHNDGK